MKLLPRWTKRLRTARRAPAPDIPVSTGPQCNICGGLSFVVDRLNRPICRQCKSKPRHRAAMLAIDKVVGLKPGMRVMHLAPEAGIAERIHAVVGRGYDPRDFDPAPFAERIGRRVRGLDLCSATTQLQANRYDLVLHNHVIEHLPCNYTMALLRLQDAVKPGGYHLFTLPIVAGYFREDADPALTKKERSEQFLQRDHMRRFGVEDFDRSLGAVFGIGKDYAMLDFMSEADLTRANIPAHLHRGVSGTSVFIVRKPS